ncbi:MAG: tRNA-(ms[2]io[6]A)-hydroxylase [Polyangiaceae bacterium]|nr:tRNA-(ms[2]io[6]A)-hydroxylase [Polyangiaceae bacterium]
MLCLKADTDPEWASLALARVDAVLADHAHCELKAAANALALAARHPDDLELVRALTDLAREEIEHFQQVLSRLAARAIPLGPPPVDLYAAELRRAANELPLDGSAGPGARLVDRLLVAALIEARSCERFKLLAAACRGDGPPAPDDSGLGSFWAQLLAAEAGHYRTFIDLAERASGGDRQRVTARLDRLADVESSLVSALARRPAHDRATIHG